MGRASDLKTMIVIESPESQKNGKGGKTDVWKNVFGEGTVIPAGWKRRSNRYTADQTENDHIYAAESVLVTVRYTEKITATCRVRRRGDHGGAWSIVGSPERSPDGGWLTFIVERRIAAI